MTTSPERSPASRNSRAAAVRVFGAETMDLMVLGGGIVGAGVARDAAMRGLRVGLAEQHDFAFGTSSRSSRLLHGGIRYLAQGRLGLVREASVEKQILARIAGHLAQPLPFVFPAYSGTDWPLWQLRIGVKLYDLLCGRERFGTSSALSRAEVLDRVPGMAPDGLKGGVRYYDALTNDARLVLDTLRSAVHHGAVIANYFRFTGGRREAGLWNCAFEDRVEGTKIELRSRAVVNATGPWAEQVPHSRVKLRLTKGIHLLVRRERLPISEAIAITQGERLLFCIPWGERVILGTTETDYRGSLDEVRALREDVDYVLETVNEFFPGAQLIENDILRTWAGLRPLIAHSGRSSGMLSRRHELTNPEPGWWDLAGGKLTTYRLMAEEAVDLIVDQLKSDIPSAGERLCRTALEPLLPVSETAGISGILPPPFSRQVVEHGCRNEWALHLDDVMVRRTGWHYYFEDARAKAEEVAGWMAEMLEWSAEDLRSELLRYEPLAAVRVEQVSKPH